MRLAWTAIVPRSLVEGLDDTTLEQAGQRVLMVSPHTDPALRIVRCYAGVTANSAVTPATRQGDSQLPAA